MDTQEDLREVKVHAISLSRPRRKKRTVVQKPPQLSWASRMAGGIRDGLSRALEPSQQGWLALLGLSSVTIKNTPRAWRALVSEGADVQAHLGHQLADIARRVGVPLVR